MSKKITIELNIESIEKLNLVKKLFKEQGHRGFKQGDFINDLIKKISDKDINQFVEANIPIEVRLKKLLADPESKALLEKSVLNFSKIKEKKAKHV